MKPEEAFGLLKKYGASENVIEHIKAVRDYALEIARNVDCDRNLVEIGAILHDIGRTRTHDIDHAVAGVEILRREGVDPKIILIVERHIGAGLTAEEAHQLGLPKKDYVPETIEEKIVCHADNLIGSKDRITIHQAIKVAREKWSPGSLDRLRQFHFEVFRPVSVRYNKTKDMTKEKVENAIGNMDVLFRISETEDQCIVYLYGHDADKASRILKK